MFTISITTYLKLRNLVISHLPALHSPHTLGRPGGHKPAAIPIGFAFAVQQLGAVNTADTITELIYVTCYPNAGHCCGIPTETNATWDPLRLLDERLSMQRVWECYLQPWISLWRRERRGGCFARRFPMVVSSCIALSLKSTSPQALPLLVACSWMAINLIRQDPLSILIPWVMVIMEAICANLTHSRKQLWCNHLPPRKCKRCVCYFERLYC